MKTPGETEPKITFHVVSKYRSSIHTLFIQNCTILERLSFWVTTNFISDIRTKNQFKKQLSGYFTVLNSPSSFGNISFNKEGKTVAKDVLHEDIQLMCLLLHLN